MRDLSEFLSLGIDGFWLLQSVMGKTWEEKNVEVKHLIQSLCVFVRQKDLKYKKGAKIIQKIIISKNLAWLLILIGGICEVAWVSGLKYADTLPLKALTGVGIAFCSLVRF